MNIIILLVIFMAFCYKLSKCKWPQGIQRWNGLLKNGRNIEGIKNFYININTGTIKAL